MPPPPRPGLPNEEEVRALVQRILDDVVDPPTAESPASPQPTPESRPGPESIAVGADHGGFGMKERIAFKLKEAGWQVVDCGTDSLDAVDYPDFAHEVAKKVAAGECHWGIVFDGAGIGSAIAANKVPGIRAAVCHDISSARNSREHNHANVLTLGAGLIGEGLAWQIVEEWLATEWAEGRHARRVSKIEEIEFLYARSG